MPEDPIEKINADIEVFGIPQPAGSPPMTESYFHLRRRQNGAAAQARLGLPAYRGDRGPAGPPAAIHQGDRTSTQLDVLATTLTEDETNFAYRQEGTNELWVWTGDTFVVYPDAFGADGAVGPPPSLSSGVLTIDGDPQDEPFGVRVLGGDGDYALSIDLPPSPQGPQGIPGPSGSIFASVDVADGSDPSNGAALVFHADDSKLHWTPLYPFEEWVVPPAGFPNVSKSSSDTYADLVTVTIPARPYPYRFDFVGGVDVNCNPGHQIDVEIRKGAADGPIVGIGKGQDGEGWREIGFRAQSDVALDPSSPDGVVAAGSAVTLYVRAVKRSGFLLGWGVRNTNAQLRIRLMRVGQ